MPSSIIPPFSKDASLPVAEQDDLGVRNHISSTAHEDRIVPPYADPDKMYDDLMDDVVHIVAKKVKRPFTIFINALPRNPNENGLVSFSRTEDVSLIYAGVQKQRALLGKPLRPSAALDKAWEKLHDTRNSRTLWNGYLPEGGADLSTKTGVVSSRVFDSFKKGRLSISGLGAIAKGTLKGYFSILGTQQEGPYQKEEQAILEAHFDLDNYCFLSLPLIQFGEMDGVLHIVCHREDAQRLDPARQLLVRKVGRVMGWQSPVAALVKAIACSYEALIVSSPVSIKQKDQPSLLSKALLLAHAYMLEGRNPLFVELSMLRYYQSALRALLRSTEKRYRQHPETQPQGAILGQISMLSSIVW